MERFSDSCKHEEILFLVNEMRVFSYKLDYLWQSHLTDQLSHLRSAKKSKETISDKPVDNILVTIAGALSIVMVSSTYL